MGRHSRFRWRYFHAEVKSRGRVGVVAVEGETSKFHAEVKSRGRVSIVAVEGENSMLVLNVGEFVAGIEWSGQNWL